MNMFSQEAQLWVEMCTSCPDNSVLILDLQFSPSKKCIANKQKRIRKSFLRVPLEQYPKYTAGLIPDEISKQNKKIP